MTGLRSCLRKSVGWVIVLSGVIVMVSGVYGFDLPDFKSFCYLLFPLAALSRYVGIIVNSHAKTPRCKEIYRNSGRFADLA